MRQEFTTRDEVIPRVAVNYQTEIPVSVVVTDERVTLTVGARHLEWDRETGELVAVWTLVEPPAPADTRVYLDWV